MLRYTSRILVFLSCIGLLGLCRCAGNVFDRQLPPTAAPGDSNTTLVPPAPTPPAPVPIAAVHQATCAPAAHNPASFVTQPGVTYLLLSKPSGKALQVTDDSLKSGAAMSMGERINGIHQLFLINDTGGQTFAVRAYHSGLPLAVGRSGADQGVQPSLDANDTWRITSTQSGLFTLTHVATQTCLETDDAAKQEFSIIPFKKGLSVGGNAWDKVTDTLKPSWVYNWGSDPGLTVPLGIEFVPMVYGYYGNAPGLTPLALGIKAKGAMHLLGYNEPDQPGQATMPVDVALMTWPYLAAGGLPLGSPAAAVADDAWMTSFMGSVKREQIQYFCVHWYGAANAQAFVAYLTSLHDRYNVPIWITEFAPADWGAASVDKENFSPQDVETFLRDLLPMIDALPFVQRFAWMAVGPNDTATGHSSLFDAQGALTAAGKVYQAYPFTP